MDSLIIEKAECYVKEMFENEFSGHDYFHSLRVCKMAEHIARSEGANIEIVKLAALLHDIDDRKLSPSTYENLDNARCFLTSHNFDVQTVDWICEIISQVSFGGENIKNPATLEGKCVRDADRLDAIGAIGIARAFAYGGNHKRHMYHPDIKPNLNMSREEYVKSESTTINHFYEKLFKLTALMQTETAKKIAKEREEYMKEFVTEFMDEWEGKR